MTPSHRVGRLDRIASRLEMDVRFEMQRLRDRPVNLYHWQPVRHQIHAVVCRGRTFWEPTIVWRTAP